MRGRLYLTQNFGWVDDYVDASSFQSALAWIGIGIFVVVVALAFLEWGM